MSDASLSLTLASDHEAPAISPGLFEDVTLCLIVKDEAAFLRAFLDEAPPCASIVIVDTGSVDDTLDIARSRADVVIESSMSGGYSEARNVALDHVSTAWVLFLDADEIFPRTEWPRIAVALEQAQEQDLAMRVLRYNLNALGGFSFDRVVRLFRNHPQLRYRRRVGESVEEAVEDLGGRIVNTGLVLNHFGGMRSVDVRVSKFEKYLELTKLQVGDYPESGLWPAYAGFLLRSLGRMDEAIEWSEKGLALEPLNPRVWAYHGHVLRALDRRSEALSAFQEAARLAPWDAVMFNMVGVLHLAVNQFEEADAAFSRALELEPNLLHARINRGLGLQGQERYSEALDDLLGVARRNPGMLAQDWRGRLEIDHFSYLFNETVPQFAGLAYHIGYCQFMATAGFKELRFPVDPAFV